MNRLMKLSLVVASTSLFACGLSKTTTAIQDNAPTYSNAALDMESGDTSSPSNEQTAALDQGSCHPYLFARTRNVVRRLNWHLYKVLFMFDHVIAEHPSAQSGATATWERKGPINTFRVVGTKVSETEFTYEVDVKKSSADDSTFVKVANADITVADATNAGNTAGDARNESGTLSIDFGALGSVVTTETATGTLNYKFSISGQQRDIEVTLANFTPNDTITDISPRNAHYVFTRTVGVGGSLKYTDELILLCPYLNGAPNTAARSSVNTVFRWTHLSDGTFVARGDTAATADSADTNTPNIPSGDKIEGVTCGTLGNGDAEKYWMMKLEDSSGATIQSGTFSYDSLPNTDPTTACDAAFGPIPSTDNGTNDYDFSSVNFADPTAVSFPSQG
ncbi:MAG: hypothetical protein JST54_04555 [Deltaproteobacteria bacterium]|nr:hypothetical protein [Deltaproteobacteria bacterium]